MAKILITLPIPAPMVQSMQAALPAGAVLSAVPSVAPEDLARHAADADIVIALSPVNRELLAAAPNARFIQIIRAGYDDVDIAAAAEAGVPVGYTPGANAVSVAEHTILLMLALLKRFKAVEETARGGGWVNVAEIQGSIGDLGSATVGLVGMGDIGRAVAERLRPFGPRLLYWSRRRRSAESESRLGLTYQPLGELLAEATIVSLHLALTPETRGLIGAAELAKMRRGALLINTGRGDLVDEAALRAAITSGHLGGAGLDVLITEAPGGNSFADLPNVIVTPHTGSASRDAVSRLIGMAVQNLHRVLAGEPPQHLVPGSPATVRPFVSG